MSFATTSTPLAGLVLNSGWETERIFCDGDAYFEAVLAAVQRSRKRVFLEFYIFDEDALGKRLIAALHAAQNRGVEVRILIDGVGSANFIGSSFGRVQQGGMNIRVYHPLPWQIVQRFSLSKAVGWRTLLRFFSYANSRNHRKMIVIDGETAFVGSLNVSEVHLSEVLNQHAWHDIGAKITGGLVETLEQVFLKSWNKSWRSGVRGNLRPELRKLAALQTIPESEFIIRNDGRALRHKALSQRLHAIRAARSRIWIANAYFVPNGQLLRALMAAAKRGVEVRILLPQISDVHFMPWVARAFYESLIRYGVRVSEYSARVLHSKVMLVDQSVWVGSSNLNHRSLLHDLELDVVLKSPEAIRQLEEILLRDFLSAHEIDKLSNASQPLLQRLLVGFLLYFRHLL